MKKYLIYSKVKFALLMALKAIYAAGFVGFSLVLQWLVNLMTADGAVVTDLVKGVGVTLVYTVGVVAIMLIKDRAGTQYVNTAVMRLRDDLSEKLLAARYEDFAKNDSAKYLSHMTNDIKTVTASYFTSMLNLPEDLFTFVFAVAAAFYINYVIAITMLILTLLILVVPLIFNKPLNRTNMQLSEALKGYTQQLKQTFLGMDVVKNFSCQDRMMSELHASNRTLTKRNAKTDRLNVYAQDVGLLIVVLLQLGSIAVSGFMLLKGVILIGSVIAVVQLSSNMYGPLMQVAGKMALISGVRDLNKTILGLIDVQPEPEAREVSFSSGIEVRGLKYAYGDEPVLRGVDARFERGKKYLLIGRSGSGKSTLLKLIGKMYNGYEGKICLDGTEYRLIGEKQLYDFIAIAQQRSYLFDMSVRDNIDFARTRDEARLDRAVKGAELTDFIAAQPAGLDEIVSEEVNQISGGEKQRIGLARALYKDADMLLLDEITSSLDKETAFRVERNILDMEGKTVIHVSHKLQPELFDRYDGVCILSEGRILEFLPPREIKKTAAFRMFADAEEGAAAE